MKDLIRREDAIKIIEGVIRVACNSRTEAACAIEHHCNLAIVGIESLPSVESASYEQPAPSRPTIMEALKCTCGNSIVCHTTVDIGVDTTVEELYCPECGIIMRASRHVVYAGRELGDRTYDKGKKEYQCPC